MYLSELDNPAARSDDHRLCAIAGAQFLHDVLDMNFDGSFRNDEFLRDATSAAVGDLLEDLNLAAGVRASSS